MIRPLLRLVAPPAQPKVVTEYGLSLIRKYEGVGPNKYLAPDGTLRLLGYICPAGKPTIGYGRVITFDQMREYKEAGGITLVQAEEFLRADVDRFTKGVLKLIYVDLKEWQLDSLVSFAYNLGLANLKKSTLLKKLNKKDYTGAANEFTKWVYASGRKLQGLVTRREAEKRMFLNIPARAGVVSKKSVKYLIRLITEDKAA